MTPEEYRKAKGEEADARALLETPAFQHVMQAVESDIVAEWKAAGNADTRETLHAEVRAMRKVMQRLRTMMATGQLADAQQKERERLSKSL